MITTHNYFEKIANIDFATIPTALQKGNEFIVKATSNGKSWDVYTSSDAIKNTIDLYLQKLNEFVNGSNKAEKKKREKSISNKNIKPLLQRQ